MNFSHANCTHPKTPMARAACRKRQGGVQQLALTPFVHVDTSAPFIGTCEHGQTFAKYRVPKLGFQGWRCRCAGQPPSPIVWKDNRS